MALLIYNWLQKYKKTSYLLFVVALVLLFVPFGAHADWFDFTGSILFKGIAYLGIGALYIMGWVLDRVQQVFELILNENINFTSHLEVIKIGWKLSRDLANMFFVFVVFAIAIATIMRLPGNFMARSLLVRVIIMAILINFSLTIGGLVIDASNALGIQFYNAIRGQAPGISDVIMSRTGLQTAFRLDGITPGAGGSIDSGSLGNSAETTESSTNLRWAILAWGNVALISVLVFIFFVATILFFVRFVALMFILMLAPLAFFSYIIPQQQQWWNRWWKELTQYAFFFPAFMFLLYFALAFSGNIQQAVQGTGGNLVDTPSLLLAYFFTIAVLLQALILGKSMGIAGADTAMAWARQGRKMAIGAVGWVGRNTAGTAAGWATNKYIAENEKVKGFQDRMTRGNFVQRSLARGVAATRERAAGAFGIKQTGERDADFLMKSARSNWGEGYRHLSSAGKAAFLNKLSAEDRKNFIENLKDPGEKAYAERIARTRLAPTADADLQASKIQRATSRDEALDLFASSSTDARERYLRTLNADERARFINDLEKTTPDKDTNDKRSAAAKDVSKLLATQFSSVERRAHDVAKFKLLTDEKKVEAFDAVDPLTGRSVYDDTTKAAILEGMNPIARKTLIDKIRSQPKYATDQQRNEAEDRARKVMRDYFTSDQLLEQESAEFAALPLGDQAKTLTKWASDGSLDTNRKKIEHAVKKMDAKSQAQLMHLITEPGAAKNMEATLRASLNPRDFAKYEAELSDLWPAEKLNREFASLDPRSQEEILRRRKKPEALAAFVDQLDGESKDKANQVIKDTFSAGEIAAYRSAHIRNLLPAGEIQKKFIELGEKEDIVKEQILRDFKPEQRATFLKTLAEEKPEEYRKAIALMEKKFTQEEQDDFAVEQFKFEADKDRRVALFALANDRVRTKILAGGFKDDHELEQFRGGKLQDFDLLDETAKRAYLEKNLPDHEGSLKEKGVPVGAIGLAEKARTIKMSGAFTGAQQKGFEKAMLKREVDAWQKFGELGDRFYGEGDDMSVKKRADILRSMNKEERESILNLAGQDPEKMAKLRVALEEMDIQEQEEFDRTVLPGASNVAAHNYLEAMQEQARKVRNIDKNERRANGLEAQRAFAFRSLKPEQQVHEWERAYDKYARGEDPEMSALKEHDALFQPRNDEQERKYNMKFIQRLKERTPEEAAKMYAIVSTKTTPEAQERSEKVRKQLIQVGKNNDGTFVLAMRDAATPEVQKTINEDIEKAGMTEKYKEVSAKQEGKRKKTAPEPAATTGTSSTASSAAKRAPTPTTSAEESVALSPAAQKIVSEPPQEAVKNYKYLAASQKKEIIAQHPDTIIAIKEIAHSQGDQESLARIENDIQESAPATRFRDAVGTPGKANALADMSKEEQQMVFEAAASAQDPRELKSLRTAIETLPPEKQKEFHETITQSASTTSVERYVTQVREDKTAAQKNNLPGKVESLEKEETVVQNIITKRSTDKGGGGGSTGGSTPPPAPAPRPSPTPAPRSGGSVAATPAPAASSASHSTPASSATKPVAPAQSADTTIIPSVTAQRGGTTSATSTRTEQSAGATTAPKVVPQSGGASAAPSVTTAPTAPAPTHSATSATSPKATTPSYVPGPHDDDTPPPPPPAPTPRPSPAPAPRSGGSVAATPAPATHSAPTAAPAPAASSVSHSTPASSATKPVAPAQSADTTIIPSVTAQRGGTTSATTPAPKTQTSYTTTSGVEVAKKASGSQSAASAPRVVGTAGTTENTTHEKQSSTTQRTSSSTRVQEVITKELQRDEVVIERENAAPAAASTRPHTPTSSAHTEPPKPPADTTIIPGVTAQSGGGAAASAATAPIQKTGSVAVPPPPVPPPSYSAASAPSAESRTTAPSAAKTAPVASEDRKQEVAAALAGALSEEAVQVNKSEAAPGAQATQVESGPSSTQTTEDTKSRPETKMAGSTSDERAAAITEELARHQDLFVTLTSAFDVVKNQHIPDTALEQWEKSGLGDAYIPQPHKQLLDQLKTELQSLQTWQKALRPAAQEADGGQIRRIRVPGQTTPLAVKAYQQARELETQTQGMISYIRSSVQRAYNQYIQRKQNK